MQDAGAVACPSPSSVEFTTANPIPKGPTAPGSEAVSGQQVGGTRCGPSVSESANEDEEENDKDSTATTLVMRNLPAYFDQTTTQDFVDGNGYADLYDFLIWFPAKKTSRLNASSYAFVNFRDARHARSFRRTHHLSRFPSEDDDPDKRLSSPLSIALAKVQGFTQNYIRFYHLTSEEAPTLCQPYFAKDAVDKLPQETRAAAAATISAPNKETLPDDPFTTLIVRNLPDSIDTQDKAQELLETAGFRNQYNFFLYLPAKRRRPQPITHARPSLGLGYAFVNFRDTASAQMCVEALNGKLLAESGPALSVVVAKVQGIEECMSHFRSLSESGRVAFWVDPCIGQAPFFFKFQ